MKSNRTLILNALLIIVLFVSCSSQQDKIIGELIRIENLEVAKYDFPERRTWDGVKKACEELGSGWRLPTKDELNLIYRNKNKIGGFANYDYWSSTETSNDCVWKQNFLNGNQNGIGKFGIYNGYYDRGVIAF